MPNRPFRQTCIWCGRDFNHASKQRYCSNDCRLTAAYFKKQLTYQGFDVTTEEACKIHRQQVEQKKPVKRGIKVLAPMHLTSSGVRWDFIPEEEVDKGVRIL